MFGPKRTLKSLLQELETGLRDGTIVLDGRDAQQPVEAKPRAYVLGKPDPQHAAVTFVGGAHDPHKPTFDLSIDRAARFESKEQALLCRSFMRQTMGEKADQYRVHELLPDGQLIDVEGQPDPKAKECSKGL